MPAAPGHHSSFIIHHSSDDTIIAISTASGISRRAIVRLSGPAAFDLVQSAVPDVPAIASRPPYTRLPATVVLADETRVPADLYLMRAPRSYTREDVAEIATFGSPVLLEMIMEDFLSRGARLAQPGEFTRRAFLNGRIDLAQAEAVLQVIRSRSESELRLALRHLGGRFSDEIAAARAQLIEICALAELSIDFTDQDIDVIAPGKLAESIAGVRGAIAALAAQGERHSGGRPGVAVAICGRPNAGKSSILNALLGRSRSIVTDVPGTTRDVVEETLEIAGHRFILSDTAGRRDTDDAIEHEAVQRAVHAAAAADLVLLVIDSVEGIAPQDAELWNQLTGTPRIAVLNKTDLLPPHWRLDGPSGPSELDGDSVSPHPLIPSSPHPIISTSCLTGAGIDELRAAMVRAVRDGTIDSSAPSFLLNARHQDAIRRATEALDRARQAADDGLSTEFVALDLRVALDSLGEIAGHACTDDLLDIIFSSFCIGK